MRRPENSGWRRIALGLLALLAGASVIASLAPFFGSLWWGFDLFSHFRLQYLAAQAVLIVACVWRRQRAWTAILAACVVVNGLPLVPYVAPARSAPAGGRLSVLNTNVWGSRSDPELLLERIRREDPDLLLITELGDALAARLEAVHDRYPYRILRPARGFFGIGLYSRYPLAAHPHASLGATAAIEASIETPAGPVTMLGIHLLPPTSARSAKARDAQLAELAADAHKRSGRTLICGDFNISPYSPTYRRFLGKSGLADARFGQGLGVSWPANLPVLGIPIDHCFVSGLAVEDVRALDPIGSDHYPQLFEFVLDSEP